MATVTVDDPIALADGPGGDGAGRVDRRALAAPGSS